MPGGLEYHPTREVTLKDQFDEWLARVVCFAFSVSPSAFISQVNRATAQTAQQTAEAEGLQPLKLWVKSLVDRLIEEDFGWGDLEFGWAEENAPDPSTLMTINTGYVAAGIKTVDEARADIGLCPIAGGDKPTPMPPPMRRYDPDEPRDERGRWTTGGSSTTDATTTLPTISSTQSYADETSDGSGDPNTESLGKRPPAPPGYDPNTWTQGNLPDGKVTLQNPDLSYRLIEHKEDDDHWRHWDKQSNSNRKMIGRIPENSMKLKPEDKPNRSGRSAIDPSGDQPDWTVEPTYVPFEEVQPGLGGGGGVRNHERITPTMPEEDEAN